MGTRLGLHVISFIKNIPITSFMKIHSVSCSRPVLFVQTDEQREMQSDILIRRSFVLQTHFNWRSGSSIFILACSYPRFEVRRPNRVNNIERVTGHCIIQILTCNRPCSVHQFLPRTSGGFLWTVHIGLKDITLSNCFHKHNVAVVKVHVALETKMCLRSTKSK